MALKYLTENFNVWNAMKVKNASNVNKLAEKKVLNVK